MRKEHLKKVRRVVIKLGTAVIMGGDGGVSLSRFYSFVEDIALLMKEGLEVLVVSSGAVGLGSRRLGLAERPGTLPGKQACAAVGQGLLMSLYADAFQRLGINTGQVLLTEDDFSNRKRYLNLRSTIAELVRLRVLPIINENDTVATAELESISNQPDSKVNFGDNDKLSALVASKIDADLLVILTDVEGLYDRDPRGDSSASVISLVEEISDELVGSILASASERARDGSAPGRGGIKTKLEAARVATGSGVACIVASGLEPGVIRKAVRGEETGTLFLPRHQSMGGRLRWIAFATTVSASLVVNEGARKALEVGKASLLPRGVVEVKGTFKRGDVVSILDSDGVEFARGMVNYDSSETRAIAGRHSDEIKTIIDNPNYDAIVTRDNLAFLQNRK
ncbi:MAG: glutamate 5-kinase [Candidatus Obscuribacterales bacterium]